MDYMMRKSIYSELNDKDWIHRKYFVENLSTIKIAKLVGASSPNSVRQAIIKFGFRPRNFREGIINGKKDLLIENREVIDGSLLGDSSLNIFNKKSKICCPYLVKKNKYEDHLLWFAGHLLPQDQINLKEEHHVIVWKGKESKCKTFVFRTLSSNKLKKYYKRWYPKENNYRKLVPRDVKITPKLLLHWFLDDGYSTWRNRNKEMSEKGWKQNKKQVLAGFCSESFSKLDNIFLINKIKQLGINCRLVKSQQGTGWRIKIDQTNTNKFFDLIGPCPIASLKYKWKIA